MIMLIGIPGSGKSHEAELLAKELDAAIHSSDKIREEMLGDANSQVDNNKVFAELHKRIEEDLKSGRNVIYDATNINSKRRILFLNSLKGIPCEKIGIIMATPYQQCLVNNQQRDRKVPVDVIKRMYMNYQTPYYYEGFDWIDIALWEGMDYKQAYEIENEYAGFAQENEHHELTLDAHLHKAFMYTCGKIGRHEWYNIPELVWASRIHDCGKPFTKTFKTNKGVEDKNAHYYQHMNVGAYDAMFWMSSIECDSLLVSWLVCNHMEPYFWKNTQSLEEKRRNLWGEDLYQMILKIHEADLAAH